MNKKLLIVLPLVSTIMFSGCATIVSGTKQQINVTSNPTNKEIVIGNYTVKTPAVLEIERGSNLVANGTNCNQQNVSRQINPWFFGNILFVYAMPFSSTTDAVSGAMWKYDKNINLVCQK